MIQAFGNATFGKLLICIYTPTTYQALQDNLVRALYTRRKRHLITGRSYAVTPANFHESEHYLPTCYTCHLDTSPDLNVNNKADNHSSCNTLGCNKTDSDNPLVVNLSSTHLNDHVISILSKGMKFCPTPGEPDKCRAKADLDEFHLKLKYYLHFNNMK